MQLVRDWPFQDKMLVLSKAERATLARAAEIAERAAAACEPESSAWYEWKALATHAADAAQEA